jgi:hypothetical protein
MEPSPAEITRTLAAGHLSARVRTVSGAEFAVQHVTDRMGRLLLLVAEGGAAERGLRPVATEAGGPVDTDSIAVLTVADRPPVCGGPWYGRVELTGWATRLTGTTATRAALDFAEAKPLGELLDVGSGMTLYRLDLAEIDWTAPGYATGAEDPDELRTLEVDVDAFLDAEPDPFGADESALLADLADHHSDLLEELCSQAKEAAVPGAESARALRVDRYGLVLGVQEAGEERWIRAGFRGPVADRRELAEIFHLLACCRCRPGGAEPPRPGPLR